MPIFQDNRELVSRLSWLRIFFVLAFVFLFVRLWSLTVVHYENYRKSAERSRIRTFPEIAPRGLIYDREGKILVDNVYGFSLLLFQDEMKNSGDTIRFLKKGLKMAERTIERRLSKENRLDAFSPIVIKQDLSMDEMAYLLAHQSERPELDVIKRPLRFYRHGSLAAHALGYVGEVSAIQLKESKFEKNKAGDLVGQYGIESFYNRMLTGYDGFRRLLVDSRGRMLHEVEQVNPVPGDGITLTLDLDLQMAAEEQLNGRPGAVLVCDARNGEILAMASHPTFYPNQFARRIRDKEWQKLIKNPDTPLQNRVIQSTFPPGSIFKLVMALAGLQRGLINSRSIIECNGGLTLYGHRFACWQPEGHGRVSLAKAIRKSCNVYFYLLGQKLGIRQIAEFSHRVGLGVLAGIDLMGEVPGLVPSEEWKQRVRGESWYAGETLSLSIGQGPILTTPLQLARVAGIFATGKVLPFHLLKDNSRRQPHQPQASLVASLSPKNLQLIRDAMWSSVNEWGTGHNARVSGFQVCGKTGTAQTIGKIARERLPENAALKFQSDAWFVGFAPRNDPEVVVTVILQKAGAGGAAAAPVAGEIFRLYQKKHKLQPTVKELVRAKNVEKIG